MTITGVTGGEVLDVRSVDLVREGRTLLSSLSVRVRDGEHWALLGANGAGKSTLLSLMGARTHPTRGEVWVLGHRLGRVDMRALRCHLGHVDPRHPLQSPLPARQVVLTGLTNTPETITRQAPTSDQATRAERLIDALGISDRATTPWPLLSQGERSRALIARALMPEPRLLLLDEPATGLDLAGREQLLTSLRDLVDEHCNLATVTVTHHLEELPSHTSHALLIRAGHIIAAGEVDQVLTSGRVTRCFDHPVVVQRHDGRWTARTAHPQPG